MLVAEAGDLRDALDQPVRIGRAAAVWKQRGSKPGTNMALVMTCRWAAEKDKC